jgi:hypothetical protein
MAKTISAIVHDKTSQFKRVFATVAADSSYPSNGYPVAATDFGLTKIEHIEISTMSVGTHFGIFDYTNSKMKVFVAAGTEVSGSADINTLRFKVCVSGY